jgi:ABC-type multidrug transport system fused ATPase/permease subunit
MSNSDLLSTQNVPLGGEAVLLQLMSDFMKENPAIIFIYVLYIVVVCLQDIVMPHFSGKIVDAITKKKPLLKPFIIIIVIVVAIQILNTITEWHDMTLFPNMQAFLRTHLLDKIFDTYRENYTEIDVATILSKLTKIPYSLFGFLDQVRYYILPQFIVYIIAIVYLIIYDVQIGIALLFIVSIIIATIAFAPKICEKAAWAAEHFTNTIANEIDDIFNNLVSVYSYDQESFEKSRLDEIHKKYEEMSKSTIRCTFNIKVILFPLIILFLTFFMYRCYGLVKRNQLETGKFVSLFLMTFYVTSNMWGLIAQIREVIPRWGRIKENISIFEEARVEKEYIENTSKSYKKINKDGLYINNISYRYNTDSAWVIQNLTMHINKNERICLVGRIGSGKTTFLKLIMGYKNPQRGFIYLDGIPYSEIPVTELRKKIGYVHQYPILFNRTIYDNIVYGLNQEKPVTREAIYKMMHEFGISDIFTNHPKGLDSNVGRKGHKLSGGQRQMVWFLRIMLMNPSLLVLDEPTASVDDQTRDIIFKMLDIIMENRTVIIVTHDDKLMKKVNRIIHLGEGAILTDSTFATTEEEQEIIRESIKEIKEDQLLYPLNRPSESIFGL